MKEIIEKGLKKAKVKGDLWYLINSSWFWKMKIYFGLEHYSSGAEGSHPGLIDNRPLFKFQNPLEVQDLQIWKNDYDLVPEEVWTVLVQEFGMGTAKVPIPRRVYEERGILKLCNVDVSHSDLMTLQLTDSARTAWLRA